jgi:ATP-dependent Clp protease ATP-binding subunit ClpA
LRRVIQRKVEDELSERMLRGDFTAGDTVHVDAVDGKLVFTKGKAAESTV